MFENLLSGPLASLALGKMEKMFDVEGVKALMITRNPNSKEPPLPGFDLSRYDVPIEAVSLETANNMRTHPWLLTNDEYQEYETLKKLNSKGTWMDKGQYHELKALEDLTRTGQWVSDADLKALKAAAKRSRPPATPFAKPSKNKRK